MMSDNYFSPHWYRVSQLRPQLLSQVEIFRHSYRGIIHYLLREPISGNNYRFNAASYQIIAQLDGEKTVEEIFLAASDRLDCDAPSQNDMINLLSKLAEAELIESDHPVAAGILDDKQSQLKASRLTSKIRNPLAIRIPLWDPDEFLVRHVNKVRWCFTTPMALLWGAIVVAAIYQVLTSWNQIHSHFAINALQPYNLLWLVILYPLVKFVHELGHGFATRIEGGEVHEMGITILFLIPIPYVNVSSSALFQDKSKRILVSGIGILIELFIAALGALLFLNTEPSILHDIGFNLLLIGGISSLVFNGNPLLKFDGYYILADAIAIPNMYQRAHGFLVYLLQKYLLGISGSHNPVQAPGETKWLCSYGVVSLLYRCSIIWFICIFIVDKLALAGLLLAAALLLLQFGIPLLNAVIFLLRDPAIGQNRARAISGTAITFGAIAMVVFLVPIGSVTSAQGIVWVPEHAQLKVGADGFIRHLKVQNGQSVRSGETIIGLEDYSLESQIAVAEARVQELRVKLRAARTEDPLQATLIREELNMAVSELSYVESKIAHMQLVAKSDGELILPEADDLPGRFLRKGDLVGYILTQPPNTVRVVVPQDYIGQIQQRVEQVQVRFASHPSQILRASISRQA